MFENLTDKLGNVFKGLTKRGSLSESDVDSALQEVRLALLEADVALPVVKDFITKVRDRAVGEEVLRSITPGQQVIKIVNDVLIEILGSGESELTIDHSPPAVILLVGLQGSGKTTTAGKLALHLKSKKRKKVMLASLDIYRPAAREQLRILGEQAEVSVLPEIDGESPANIAKRAMAAAKIQAIDVLILDTAGRTTLDAIMMSEAKEIFSLSKPSETLLVADAMTGQDAVQTAKAFSDIIKISGVILTRSDGDARGGAALSMKAVTGCPIKFVGVSEKLDGLEPFYPERAAGRILDMGDVVSLVEKAAETIAEEDAAHMMKRMSQGSFDMNDMLKQIGQLKKMGGLGGIMSMLPGIGKLQKQMAANNFNDKAISKQEAIIYSMTKQERINVGLLNASRRKRISFGSGSSVSEVNRLVKQQQDMARMMKKMGKMGGLKSMMSSLGGSISSSENPSFNKEETPIMDAGKMAEIQKLMGGNMSNRFGGMGLPGLGGKSSKKRR
ncbi:MAG: signal recognition particle protein [Proteobacteria bacterium]|jgi:signal recognition particle subunit SRP54|nr:signal recognition particle protein [Pseudomonadota bacterium]MDA1135121.1 signal recognition particle protein [Pseudomonadota bacterium]